MKRYLLLHIIICCCVFTLKAQTAVQADKLFIEQNYTEAKAAYANLLKRDARHALYLYRYARCAYELGETQEAIAYFEKAGTKYALRDFYLGELYKQTYRFDQALTAYQRYLSAIDSAHERYRYVAQQIEYVEKGIRYLRRVVDIAIIDSVVLPKSTFLQAYKLGAESGSLTDSLGAVTYTNQRNDRRILTDKVHNRFALLSCQRLLDGWSACDTLRLELTGNANYPFVLSDGLTLYFASDDKAGLGGYDIYLTRYNAEQNTYLTPENVGFPINSSANDYMLAIDEVTHRGYFATDRFTPDSLVAIYTFIPNSETRILRDVDSAYLRAAAQLKAYRKDTTQAAKQHWTQTTSSQAADIEVQAFFFVVNDAIVCHNSTDFQSIDARNLLKNYLRMEKEITKKADALHKARIQYAKATQNERTALANTILQFELQIPQLQAEYEALAAQIRLLELRARE